MKTKKREIFLKGIPICRGVAIGKPFFFTLIEDSIPEFTIAQEDIKDELKRYSRAVNQVKDDIKRLQKKLKKERILEGAAILDAHLQIMQDPLMTTQIAEEIHRTRKNAEVVFQKLIKKYQKRFQKIADPFFRERFKDIQDISRRVMKHLRESVRISLADIPPSSIVFSREISASDTVEANTSCVNAFVTELGGSTSHAAIVAKAKGIPYVISVDFKEIASDPDQIVIVDGRTGDIIFNPSQKTLKKYQGMRDKLESHLQMLIEDRSLTSKTRDGHAVILSANIDSLHELDTLYQHGSHGVGLFRSEHIFMNDESFPSEEEQFEVYKEVVQKMNGLPIVIRTFDVGGDKLMIKHKIPPEDNPFLGCRAIRFFLKERKLFKTQLRAIFRASVYGNVHLMFPMISSYSEIVEAKKVIKEVKDELRNNGIKFKRRIPIGCMIEVPSAAIIADLIAQECHFLSIGTNDLVQYALAVDRGNHAMSNLYTPSDPSVLRLIKHVVTVANDQGIQVSVCGEIAADPRFTSLLLGLGVHEFSVASRYLPLIKNVIHYTSISSAIKLADKALTLMHADDIHNLLTKEYKKRVPKDEFFNY